MTLSDKFWIEFEKIADEFRESGQSVPYPNMPPAEIENMEYREDFGLDYKLYLEELNKTKGE